MSLFNKCYLSFEKLVVTAKDRIRDVGMLGDHSILLSATSIIEKAKTSLVKFILEYAITVCDPSVKSQIYH